MARSILETDRKVSVSGDRDSQLELFDRSGQPSRKSLVNLALATNGRVGAAAAAGAAAIGSGNALTPASEQRLRGKDPKSKSKGKREMPSMVGTAKVVVRATSKKSVKGTGAAQSAKLSRRDRVVMEHLPLVKAIAVRVHESLPVHVDLDDLVHAGILGLFDAATKYNPDKKVVFSSYAKHRIKGAILDSLRQLDWASRDLRRRHKQVEQVTRDLAATLHRTPTEDELAEKMGVAVARWRQMALDLRNVGLISASTRPADQEDLPAPEFPSKPETQPDSMCAHEQLKEVLDNAMSSLPERYKKVVVMYYTNEMTMKEIGGLLGINESRVSQIHKSALEKMMVVLQEHGITSCRAF
jgi:RNA polymerase sigma factor for flagellar operon FliA